MSHHYLFPIAFQPFNSKRWKLPFRGLQMQHLWDLRDPSYFMVVLNATMYDKSFPDERSAIERAKECMGTGTVAQVDVYAAPFQHRFQWNYSPPMLTA